MRGTDLLEKLELIDPAYIEAADAAPRTKKPYRLKKCLAVAACLTLLLSIGLGTYAYAAEAREYNDAVQFFNDYALSTEGLTRGEIKKVYRDITTRAFSYSKTAEVLQNSLSNDSVGGYEIFQESPTPEELEWLWNYKNSNISFPEQTGIHYKHRSEFGHRKDGSVDHGSFQKSYFEKYNGNTLVWSVTIPEFQVFGHAPVSDGVIAYGETPTFTEGIQYAWLTKLDNSGNVLWMHRMDNGFESEYIEEILENADGSYAVISRGDLMYFCLSRYTANGERTNFQKTEVGNYGFWKATCLEDGYLVQLGSHTTGERAKIVKVDREGNITDSFSYGAEDVEYVIEDMAEFDGKIYLSGYAVPKADNDYRECQGIVDYLYENDKWDISNEELTPLIQQNYTAILLVCDPTVGTPQEFYSVKESVGGTLSLGADGTLLWDVERIATVFYSPYTSSFTFGGTCDVFQYTFDSMGSLIRQEKTGEFTSFRR